VSTILVVDDKEMMRDSVATTLSRKGHTVVTCSSGKDALDRIGKRSFDAVITDLQMPGMDGLELVAEIRQTDEQLPVVFMTAYGTIETAVDAMKLGAFDYITKPFSGDVLLVTVERAIKHAGLLRENQILKAAATTPGTNATSGEANRAMVGGGPCMAELRDRISMIACSHSTVLITGESGAGKEVAARAIHEQSPRAKMPFLAVNCAALSTSLLESELFGHEKGAFTGADKLRKGRFELADGGTLLLDEISEIAPEIQAKLLRVLQEQCFERVGSSVSRSVDVRVIATTNRQLQHEVEKGAFRQDLFFRLNVLPVTMPALRDHAEDIPDLVAHFLQQVAGREGRPVKRVTDEAMELFVRYRWPGNVRELQNLCERAAVLTPGEAIEASLIRPWLSAGDVSPMHATARASSMIEVNGHANGHAVGHSSGASRSGAHAIVCDGELTLEDIERDTIIATLEANHGHRQKSAEALGIGVRTLGLKLKKWKELELVDASL
jgi:two-component system, NtrC family, response regulator HydG